MARWRLPAWAAVGFICAALFVMEVVGAAGAATGIVPVGGEIEGGTDTENAREHGNDDQQVVARGTSPVAGPWRLTALKKSADENSPEGDCLQLLLIEPPKGSPISATILCQDVGESEFRVDTAPAIDVETGRSEIMLFGSSPTATESVELASGGETLRVKTTETPTRSGGRPWLIVAPPDLKTAKLVALDQAGAEVATIDAARYLDQLAIWERRLK